MNRASLVDRNLDQRVANFDTRIESGFAGLVRAAQSVKYFATDRIEDLDSAITNRVAGIDRRVEAFVIETNGGVPHHAGQRASAAPPWVATTLTLVLGTLGAATGAAALNADPGPVNVDRTVQIDASAAHQAVQQYLGIRDSFIAAAASRTRQISSLQADIAAAQEQASRTTLPGTEIVDVANNYGGVPYVRGGTSPRGFDCSGYTQYVYRQLGVKLPRTAAQQAAWADKVSASDRQVGDLMFWHGSGGVYHVGIYAGDGLMWDSPYPGRRVGKKGIWGNPTYGRAPASALNGAAIEEIAAKTAELQALQDSAPSLSITIDPQNTLPAADYVAPAQAVK
jgi:cell wall-associated NlpC family hydrolase